MRKSDRATRSTAGLRSGFCRCILLLEDLDAAFTRSLTRDASSTGAPTVATKQASEASDGSTLSLSGLLNSLDGALSSPRDVDTILIGAPLFRCHGCGRSPSLRVSDSPSTLISLALTARLYSTTNHIDRLDSALSRPGRLDVW